MPPEERLQRAFEYSAFVRSFAEAGVRSAYPNATDREVFLIGARRRLGGELFRRVYANEIEADGSLRPCA